MPVVDVRVLVYMQRQPLFESYCTKRVNHKKGN